MAISEELELDISGALDAIESLNESLTGLGESLTITLTGAIEAVDVTPLVEQLAALDASGLTTTIDAAIDATDAVVPIDADTAAVPEEINASIDSADTTVTLDADVSDFGGSIDEALAAADTSIPIVPEVGDIASEIEAEVQSADTTVTLEVDSSGLDQVESDLGGITGGVDTATESFGGLDATVAGLAGGDVLGGITSQLGKAGPAGTIAAAGIGAATAGIFALVEAGTDALASQQRFADTFGNLAEQASRVKLGDLNADLGELAIQLGSDDEGLQDAASSLFQFGEAAGFTSEQSLELVNNASALAARAVALNPALGQVGDVAASISNAFARGGKFAAKYGLSLTAAEINARALANTGKLTAAELSIQDKAFAGSQIAAERYGAGIEKTITKGSKNAAIQQRSLTEQLSNFIEEAGKPLVAPFQQILKELLPVVKELLPVFSELALAVLPVVAQVIKDNIPLIKLFGQLFKELSPLITPLVRASLLLLNPLTGIASAFSNITSSGAGLSDLFSGINDAIGSFLVTIVNFGSDLIDSFLVGIKEAFPAVINFFANLGTTIFNAIGDVLTSITQKGTDIITGLFTGVTTAVVAVFTFFTNLPGTIFNTIGNVVGILTQKGVDLLQGMVVGLGQKVQEVFAFVRGIPGRIRGAIGNVLSGANSLVRVGVDLISGLINGIISRAGDIVRVLKKRVTDVIPGFIKSALGIGSPSKVLAKIGEDIGGGLIQGLDSSLVGIKKSSAAMVAAALPIPGVGRLPAVAAALPVSAGSAAAVAAGTTSITGSTVAQGNGGIVINVHTTNPDPVAVGLETVRQLRAESFRSQR